MLCSVHAMFCDKCMPGSENDEVNASKLELGAIGMAKDFYD